MKSRPLAERFRKYAPEGAPGECWPWTRGVNNEGYGMIRVGDDGSAETEHLAAAAASDLYSERFGRSGVGPRSRLMAHRVAWCLRNGPPAPGMVVCHRCDVPACCNPDHMFLGTDADNTRDRNAKGRMVMGVRRNEKGGNSKLSLETVAAIRESGLSTAQAAAAFGCSLSTIYNVRAGKTWKTWKPSEETVAMPAFGPGATPPGPVAAPPR